MSDSVVTVSALLIDVNQVLEIFVRSGSKAAVQAKARLVDQNRLLVEGRTRDVAMFNLAIDSKLRAAMLLPSRSKISHHTDNPPRYQPVTAGEYVRSLIARVDASGRPGVSAKTVERLRAN